MTRSTISRRSLLLSAVGAAACGPPKATGIRGFCLVANRDSQSVTAIDLNRFRVRKQIPLDAAPSLILAHPALPKAFVLAPDAGAIYEIDARSLAAGRRASAGKIAVGMKMSPRQDALWVLYREPALLVEFPLDSLQPRRQIRLDSPPGDFDLSRENQAAIASLGDGSIAVASLSRSAIERTITVKDEPSLIRFRDDGKQLIAASQAGRNLTIFDVPTGKTVVRLPLPLAPRNLCLDYTGGQIYVTGDGMDAVAIVYPHNTEVAETILAGHAPGAMAVTLAPPYWLLVANPESDRITVLDVNTMGKTLVTVVEVGKSPGNLLMTPDNQYAFALNEKSNDLAVIRVASLEAGKPYKKPTPVFTMIPVGEMPVSAAVVMWPA